MADGIPATLPALTETDAPSQTDTPSQTDIPIQADTSILADVSIHAETSIQSIANVPFLWILAIAVLGVVGLQSAIYMVAVKRNAEAADMSPREVTKAFRAGGIAAIGPSLAVVLVAVALLPLFGTPPVLVRIGLIGSAATEVASAELAAQTMGSGLSGDGYTADVFVVAVMAMSLSGAGWMIATLVLTPLLKTGSAKLQKVSPALMSIVPGAALLAAFASLAMTELPKSSIHAITVFASALVMAVCLAIAHFLTLAWMREWALGFAIIGGLVVAYFVHHAA